MIEAKTILLATNGPDLIDVAMGYDPASLVIVGKMPDDPIPAVLYLDAPQRFEVEFDLFLSDVDKRIAAAILAHNFGRIRNVAMSSVVIHDAHDMAKLGLHHRGNLHGMLWWSRELPEEGDAQTSGRKKRVLTTKKIRRPPRPPAPLDLLPCIHRGGRRGVMFDGQKQHEVRDCSKHMTCWQSLCEKCQDRQE